MRAETPKPLPAAPAAQDPLVEVLDGSGRAVALLPASVAEAQKLRRRAVAVLLFDEQGRHCLRRRGEPGRKARWDVPAHGPVLAGEALHDAAIRVLESQCGLRSERLRPLLRMPAQPENGNELLQVFVLSRHSQPGQADEAEGRDYAFTAEELRCLLRDFRELVSPRFLLLAEALAALSASQQPG